MGGIGGWKPTSGRPEHFFVYGVDDKGVGPPSPSPSPSLSGFLCHAVKKGPALGHPSGTSNFLKYLLLPPRTESFTSCFSPNQYQYPRPATLLA